MTRPRHAGQRQAEVDEVSGEPSPVGELFGQLVRRRLGEALQRQCGERAADHQSGVEAVAHQLLVDRHALLGQSGGVGAEDHIVDRGEQLNVELTGVGQADEQLAEVAADRDETTHRPVDHDEAVLPGGRNGHPATGHPTAAKATAPALLEREAEMDALVAAAADAAAGCGSVVLVTGEAGSGKTSVARAFLDTVRRDLRVLSGACDDLVAPRTLGPLRDAVVGTGGPLERAFAADRSGDAVFAAVTEELAGPEPTVLVVEDVHWADDTTLDVLRFVARRLNGLRLSWC